MEAIAPHRPDPLVVLLPSVHWRREGLQQVLADLALQELPPERVHVFLDGWGSERPTVPDGLRVEMHENRCGQGAWVRWLFMELLAPQQLVATMDDDMAIAPWYTKCAVGWHHALDNAVLSWGGHDEQYQRVWYNTTYEKPTQLIRPMAGITVFRACDLQGMTTMESAEELIDKDSPEEALIAIHLWKQGRALLRPPGASGLSALKTANDRRCNYHQHGRHWATYFKRGSQLTGWPHGSKLAQQYGDA